MIRAAHRVVVFVLGLVASTVFVVAIAYTGVTKLGGYQAMPVLSGSMEPTMKTGSLAFVKPLAADRVVKGDVVTFQQPDAPAGTFITHRVHKLTRADGQTLYTTKGDANELPDPWRLKAVGAVGELQFDVPYLGYAIVYLGLRDVRVVIFLTLCAGFLLMLLASIWRREPAATAGAAA